MEDMLQVGVIANTHGIRGEVKVFPTTDDVKRFDELKEVIMETEKGKKILHISSVKYFKNMAIVHFAECDNCNDAELLKGKSLYVTREHAVKLKKDEYFIADLIGLTVISDDGEELGRLKQVLQTGANDVYIIEKENTNELLIPAIRECILNIDLEAGNMKVHLLPGLR